MDTCWKCHGKRKLLEPVCGWCEEGEYHTHCDDTYYIEVGCDVCGNIYAGTFDNENWYRVTLNGGEFDPKPSQEVWNHSPDGFAWSYGGSGPAQLALAILLNEVGHKLALKHYQNFKAQVIAALPQDSWALTSEDVRKWLERNAQDDDE